LRFFLYSHGILPFPLNIIKPSSPASFEKKNKMKHSNKLHFFLVNWLQAKSLCHNKFGTQTTAAWQRTAQIVFKHWIPIAFPQPFFSIDSYYICRFCVKSFASFIFKGKRLSFDHLTLATFWFWLSNLKIRHLWPSNS
jgi:hypothetical protein